MAETKPLYIIKITDIDCNICGRKMRKSHLEKDKLVCCNCNYVCKNII